MRALSVYGGSPTLRSTKATSISRGIELTDTSLAILGELQFDREPIISTWTRAHVTRTFDVVVRDADGNPVPGATVVLRDARGRSLDRETADGDGRCALRVPFHSDPGSGGLEVEVTTRRGKSGKGMVRFAGPTQIVIEVH
jgi:hypothetical protein